MSATITVIKLGRTDEWGRPLQLGSYTTTNNQFALDLVSQGYATLDPASTLDRRNYVNVPFFHGTTDPVNDDGRPNGTIYIKTV